MGNCLQCGKQLISISNEISLPCASCDIKAPGIYILKINDGRVFAKIHDNWEEVDIFARSKTSKNIFDVKTGTKITF